MSDRIDSSVSAKRSQGIQNSQDADTHIREHGHPHSGETERGERQHGEFYTEGENDIFPGDAHGFAGDANRDRSVDLKDVVAMRRYVTGGYGERIDRNQADINSDGAVNLKDIVILRRYLAGNWNTPL